jgi:putative endonuclease
MKTYFVYILKCSDDSFYTGITNNLDKRIYEHNVGIDIEVSLLKEDQLN